MTISLMTRTLGPAGADVLLNESIPLQNCLDPSAVVAHAWLVRLLCSLRLSHSVQNLKNKGP
jgi:hypothetical protein